MSRGFTLLVATGLFVSLWPAIARADATLNSDGGRSQHWEMDYRGTSSPPTAVFGKTYGAPTAQDWSYPDSTEGTDNTNASIIARWGDAAHDGGPLTSTYSPPSPGNGGTFHSISLDASEGLHMNKTTAFYAYGIDEVGGVEDFTIADQQLASLTGFARGDLTTSAPHPHWFVQAQITPFGGGAALLNYTKDTTSPFAQESMNTSALLDPGRYIFTFTVDCEYNDIGGSAAYTFDGRTSANFTLTVPEPASLSLLSLTAILAMRRRNQCLEGS